MANNYGSKAYQYSEYNSSRQAPKNNYNLQRNYNEGVDSLHKLTTGQVLNDNRLYIPVINHTKNTLYNKLERFSLLDPYNTINNYREYVFFTKPDLYLLSSDGNSLNPQLTNNPVIVDVFNRRPEILHQLQQIEGETPFMCLLCNKRRSTLDLPSLSANETQSASNIYGTSISYRRDSLTSDNAFEFNVEFQDTRNMEVYTLFKVYDEFCRLKNLGNINLHGDGVDPKYTNYLIYKILYDQFSAYKFIVGDDGYTIVFFAKYYGIFPKNIPRDILSDLSDTYDLRLTVGFKAQFVDDSDINILADFNKIVSRYYKTGFNAEGLMYNSILHHTPAYDDYMSGMNFAPMSYPFIGVEKDPSNNGRYKYTLRWRE